VAGGRRGGNRRGGNIVRRKVIVFEVAANLRVRGVIRKKWKAARQAKERRFERGGGHTLTFAEIKLRGGSG